MQLKVGEKMQYLGCFDNWVVTKKCSLVNKKKRVYFRGYKYGLGLTQPEPRNEG